jgi:hypothetical protein
MKNTMSSWYEYQFKNLSKRSGYQTVYRVAQKRYIQGGADVTRNSMFNSRQAVLSDVCATLYNGTTHKKRYFIGLPYLFLTSRARTCVAGRLYQFLIGFKMSVGELIFIQSFHVQSLAGTPQNRTPHRLRTTDTNKQRDKMRSFIMVQMEVRIGTTGLQNVYPSARAPRVFDVTDSETVAHDCHRNNLRASFVYGA